MELVVNSLSQTHGLVNDLPIRIEINVSDRLLFAQYTTIAVNDINEYSVASR